MRFFWIFTLIGIAFSYPGEPLPEGFVYLRSVDPTIQTHIRYCSPHNFVGDTIDGYLTDTCIVSKPTAEALKLVQQTLKKRNLGLLVFDGYRPQMAVDHFVKWARVLDDTLMKPLYYPGVHKKDLFKEGYIASKSGHSRGSTVDLSLIYLTGEQKGQQLDMGTDWDFFGEASWPFSKSITPDQASNRWILRDAMMKHGFKPLKTEWWHFTLRNEPYSKTYFNFPVQ